MRQNGQGEAVKIRPIRIGRKLVGPGRPVYIVAELSANHNQSFDRAVELVRAAKLAGADAVKVQTYTADTLTFKSDKRFFRIGKGNIWSGQTLHALYSKAHMPWDWQPRLKELADDLEMDFFSTPFDASSVDFLEEMGVPAYKVASFELVDIPLIRRIASTGKPVVMSTGMAGLDEIGEAVDAVLSQGNRQVALLKCTSEYPAEPRDMNLRTIPDMERRFGLVVGLSDHSHGIAASVAAVALGACMVEKHFTLCRKDGGPDGSFSLEPLEFENLVKEIRVVEPALGKACYVPTAREMGMRKFRRSLFVVEKMERGEFFTERNLKSVRPADGMAPKFKDFVVGKRCTRAIEAGTPLRPGMIKDWRME